MTYKLSLFVLITLLAMGLSAATVTAQDPAPQQSYPAADPPDQQEPLPVGYQGHQGVMPNYTGCGGVTAPGINAAYEQEVVERVNQKDIRILPRASERLF